MVRNIQRLALLFLLLIGIVSSSTASFQPSQSIQIVSQTYLDTYLSWKFTQVDEKTWTATFMIDSSFLTDIKNCTAQTIEKMSCLANLCTKYSKTSNGTTVFNCATDGTRLSTDILNLTNYPVVNLTRGISLGNVAVDMTKGSGTFSINFPDGFKEGETAKFGFGTTIINTSTANVGGGISMLGSQYKSYFAAGLFWTWYDNGTNITYSVSTDGVTFVNETAVRPCATAGDNGGYDFSVWYNGTYVSYAYNDRSTANTPLFYRRGTPNADGTITWSANEQTVFAGVASRYFRYPSVITDDQGYPWITYVNATTSFYPWVTKSSTNDGTWTTQFATQLSSTTSGSWSVHIAPLTAGKVITAYSYANLNGKVRTWDGAAWNAELTTVNLCITNGYCLSMVAEGNNAHIAMLGTDSKIYYFNYTYDTNALSSETALFTGIADSYPHLTYNGTGTVYLFYINTPDTNHVYYRTKSITNAWSGATDWVTITNLNKGQNDYSQFYQNYSGYLGFMAINNYTVGTSNITFDFLNYTSAVVYNPSFNVTWNYPVNDTWNTTTQNIKHYFTPLWNNNTIDSVSLWTNKTGTFALAVANSSAVTNNTMGYLQYDYGVDSPMIYAYFNITNTTGTSNFTANFTIKIDALPPTYLNAGVNSTSPNILDDVAFYSQWNDGITLDKYIFSWNASGVGCNTWANDTPAAFQTANWTNTTKQIPATCLGAVDEIAYMFYANDTNNHLNNTGIQLPFVFNPFFNVTWNYPANNTWNTTTQTIVHVYTPYWADSALVNCSLWMNKTGSFALEASNATPLSDNTANTITYNYAADSSQVWSYINCTNSSGSSNYTSNYTIKIDTVKPVTSATPVDGSSNPYTFTTWSNNPPITTTLSCSDATSLCLITKYCTDAPNSCTPTTTYSTPVAISSDGTTYIRYNSSDNAGNKETIASGAVMVDVGSPTTTPTATKDDSSSYTFNTWAKTTYIDVTLTGADETSGLANTKYCADTSNACTPTTTVLAPVHVATTGTSYVRYYSTDNAGNTETISSVILKIDPTAPATTATAVNNDSTSYTFGAWTTSVYVNVTLTCTDTGGSGCLVTYYCNDTDNSCTPDTEYTTPVEITTNGSSFIRYNSTDNVGNYGTIQSKHILIDPYYLPAGLIPPMSIGTWESIIGGGLGTMFGSGTYCFGGSGETCVGGVSIDMGSVLMAIFLLGFIFIWASVSGIAWDGVFFLLMIVLVILAMPVGGLLGTTAWGMYIFIWVIVIMALFYKTIFRRG